MQAAEPELSPHVSKAVQQLVSCVPPAKLRRTLRMLLLEYLAHQPENMPPELEQVAEEMICLFRFLDAVDAKESGLEVCSARTTVHRLGKKSMVDSP